MAADHAALEARVAELEQQVKQILPHKIDAVSYGVGVMHADMRERFDDQAERLNRIELRLEQQGEALDSQGSTLADHGRMLAEILDRLGNLGVGT